MEVLIAAGVMAVGISIVLDATIAIGKLSYHQTQVSESVLTLDSLSDELSAAAETATAIYSSPAAPDLTPLVFLQYDNAGTAHRWGWVYDSSAKTLTKCTKYNPAAVNDYDLACTGVSSSVSLASFSVTALHAETLSASMHLPAEQDVSTQMDDPARDPSGIVAATNTVHEVSFSLGTGARTVDLLQGARPLSVNVITHHNTAPQVGPITGPGAVSVGVGSTVTPIYGEVNSSQYAAYLGANGGWSVTACTGTGSALPKVSVTSGDTATVSVTGVTPGTCTLVVTVGAGSYPVTVTITAGSSGSGGGGPPPDPVPSPPFPTFTQTGAGRIGGGCSAQNDGRIICHAGSGSMVEGPYPSLSSGPDDIIVTVDGSCIIGITQITSSDGLLKDVGFGKWAYPMPANGQIPPDVSFTITSRISGIGDVAGSDPYGGVLGACTSSLTFTG